LQFTKKYGIFFLIAFICLCLDGNSPYFWQKARAYRNESILNFIYNYKINYIYYKIYYNIINSFHYRKKQYFDFKTQINNNKMINTIY
jgi:hypothetical protein